MKDKTFTFRINNDLLDSLSKYCEQHEISKSVFIVKAIKKALESEGIESPKSLAPSVVDSSINVSNSLNIDELKKALEGDLKPLIESISRELLENYLKANKALNSAFDEQSIEKIESQIDELKESQIAINDKIYQRLENLENQSTQEVKPLEMETEKATSQLSIMYELPHETKEADSPTELTLGIEVNDSVLSTLTPDQQSVLMAIIEGKSENEIKSLIPVTGNKLYLQGLAKSLGFKNVTSMGINKLIPLMKKSLSVANKQHD